MLPDWVTGRKKKLHSVINVTFLRKEDFSYFES
jgi:hypothetical protein